MRFFIHAFAAAALALASEETERRYGNSQGELIDTLLDVEDVVMALDEPDDRDVSALKSLTRGVRRALDVFARKTLHAPLEFVFDDAVFHEDLFVQSGRPGEEPEPRRPGDGWDDGWVGAKPEACAEDIGSAACLHALLRRLDAFRKRDITHEDTKKVIADVLKREGYFDSPPTSAPAIGAVLTAQDRLLESMRGLGPDIVAALEKGVEERIEKVARFLGNSEHEDVALLKANLAKHRAARSDCAPPLRAAQCAEGWAGDACDEQEPRVVEPLAVEREYVRHTAEIREVGVEA